MNNLIHLDCSLEMVDITIIGIIETLINDYLNVLSSVNIDYCEIGFRFLKNTGFKGACAFTSEEFLNSLEIPKNIKLAIMISTSDLINNNELIMKIYIS